MIDASALKKHYDQEGFVLIESLFETLEIKKQKLKSQIRILTMKQQNQIKQFKNRNEALEMITRSGIKN